MQSDLTYFLWMHLAALGVGITTLGMAAWVHFSEDRWGQRPGDLSDTDHVTDTTDTTDVSASEPTHEHERAA